ncbi:diguanylate cyclase [Luteimonas vadosa]|uniref:diguanylate cyclase n=1 Tax=Luteimonas vadosa TaxID=1165507 RepID=A0ABP9E3K7_9GAMM
MKYIGPGISREAPPEERELLERVLWIRVLGCALGVLPVAMVLYERAAGPMFWIITLLIGFGWPHVASWNVRHSLDVLDTEMRNKVFDSVLGGVCIAIMEFNVLPSVVVVTMLSIDKVGMAGWQFMGRTLLLLLVVSLVTAASLGLGIRPQSSMPVVLATLPLLFAYPVAISTVLYLLARKVVSQNQDLDRLNRTDVLTSLPNRRHWEEQIAKELARHQRTERPAVLMVVDVDNFKNVNDRHGHAVGDQVLRQVAAGLVRSIRPFDMAARIGGDEFAVFVTEADIKDAREVAERIRTHFLELRGSEAASEDCTLSIGLAEIDETFATSEDWMKHADAAMYRAKAAGGNRTGIDFPIYTSSSRRRPVERAC